MNNAGCHGGGRGNIEKTTLTKMRKFVDKHKERLAALCPERDVPLPIHFVAQPSNSPDLNVLDLGAWNSLRVAVENLRKKNRTHELRAEEIRVACLEAWKEWDGEKLEKLFSLLEKILIIIRDSNGDKYEIPH